MLASGSRVGRSHTPQDCCVRFAVVVAFHAATLATGRALPLTRTGLSPAGTRQLSWRTNGWPMHSPVNASPASWQMPPHDSGASVVRYTFTARDFHSLLFAGFAGALITSFPLTIEPQPA